MNTINELTNEKTDQSNSLKLESLIQQYNLLLTEYQLIYQSYLQSQVNDGSNNQSQWVGTENAAFWGYGGLSEGPASTILECKNKCAANSLCTGATFDPSNKYCWIRSGDGTIIPSQTNEVAIIPQSTLFMMALKIYNSQMLSVNEEIIQLSSQLPLTHSETRNHVSSQTLQGNYQQLMKDRKMIHDALAENNSLNEERKDTELSVTHYYYLYFFLFLVFLFLMYLLFYQLLFSNTNSGSQRNDMMMGGSTNKIIKYLNQMFSNPI